MLCVRVVLTHSRSAARDWAHNGSPNRDTIRVAAHICGPALCRTQALALVDQNRRYRRRGPRERGCHNCRLLRRTRLPAASPLQVEAAELLAVAAAVREPRGEHTEREEQES